MNLSISVSGITLKHPIMNASGVLASSPQGVKRLIRSNVSAIVTKTLTLNPREGYDPPIVVPLEYGLINAVGLANPGINAINELVDVCRRHGVPIIASIGGKNEEEFVKLAEKALDANVDGIELNLSCPHTPGYGSDTANLMKSIIKNVAGLSNKPVWAKLGFDRNIVREAGMALEAGANALVLINTIPAMVIDVHISKPILSNKFGGLSGPAIHPIAVYSVYMVYEEYSCDIIGVGGVVDWYTALELILAGAKALQIATAFYMKGYGVVNEIIRGIIDFMDKNGFSDLRELVGRAHQ